MLPGYFLPAGTDLSQPPPGYKPNQCYDMSQSQEEGTMESEVEFVGANDNDVEVNWTFLCFMFLNKYIDIEFLFVFPTRFAFRQIQNEKMFVAGYYFGSRRF